MDQGHNTRPRTPSRARPAGSVRIAGAAPGRRAGMRGVGDFFRRAADQARQAQAVMERMRTLGAGIDALTWRTLATRKTERTDTVLSEGLGSYKQLTTSLRRLRALGVSRPRTVAVERRLGEAYGQ